LRVPVKARIRATVGLVTLGLFFSAVARIDAIAYWLGGKHGVEQEYGKIMKGLPI
jgi:hypothetical protein